MLRDYLPSNILNIFLPKILLGPDSYRYSHAVNELRLVNPKAGSQFRNFAKHFDRIEEKNKHFDDELSEHGLPRLRLMARYKLACLLNVYHCLS